MIILKKIILLPLLFLAILTLLCFNIDSSDGIVVNDPEEKSYRWEGADYVTRVEVELNDSVVDFSGTPRYWFDASLLDYSVSENNYTVILDFDVQPNNLTDMLTAPSLNSAKLTSLNSNYSFLGKSFTNDNLNTIMNDLNDIPLIAKSGNVSLSTYEKITVGKSYQVIIDLENAYAGTRHARFKLGRNSFDWTVTTQQNWVDNTLTADNIAVVDGRLVFENIAEWEYSRQITIDKDFVENENFTSFPMLIQVDLDNSHCLDNGQDIRFLASDETTQLDHEIESFDGVTLIAWVRIPTLYCDVDTVIYIHYGNADATEQENPTGVWDDNYAAVWHMYDNSTSTILDSTSNNQDGVKKGANEPQENDGKIWKCENFDGTDDNIRIGRVPALEVGDNVWTISGWYKMYVNVANSMLFSYNDDHQGGAVDIYVYWSGTGVRYQVGGSGAEQSSTINDLVTSPIFHQIVLQYDGTNALMYEDGIVKDNGALDFSAPDATYIFAFGYDYNINYWKGSMDEVRISDVARTPNWIHTAFTIENNPTGAITVGAETANDFTYEVNGTWFSTHWELGILSTIDNFIINATTDLRGEWDLSDNISSPYGITYATSSPDYWYLHDTDSDKAEVFGLDFSYIGASSLSNSGSGTTGINYGSVGAVEMILVCEAGEIDNYNIYLVYQNSIDVSGEMSLVIDVEYMENDDTYYVFSFDDDNVYVYDGSGTYMGISKTLGLPPPTTSPHGFNHDGQYWYVIDYNEDRIYQYDNNFTLIGAIRSVGADDAGPTDIHSDTENIYMTGIGTDSVYRYRLDNTLDNIYAMIVVDTDNDNVMDENTGWHLMDENGYWTDFENAIHGYVYQVGFRIESSDNMYSPRIGSFRLEVDYKKEWISVENWSENFTVVGYAWVSVENWDGAFRVEGVSAEPLTDLTPLVENVLVPLMVLFAPAIGMAGKMGEMGFMMGLGLGAMIVYIGFGFSIGIIIFLLLLIGIIFIKGKD